MTSTNADSSILVPLPTLIRIEPFFKWDIVYGFNTSTRLVTEGRHTNTTSDYGKYSFNDSSHRTLISFSYGLYFNSSDLFSQIMNLRPQDSISIEGPVALIK